MKRHALLAMMPLLLAASGAAGGILFGPVMNPANRHEYVLLTSDTWTNSETQAVALGGHLATINDQAEQDWVFDVFARAGGSGRGLWTGLHRTANGAPFVWASGEALGYTHWSAGEPNFPDERFVLMLPTLNSTPLAGFWNNDYDRTTAAYSGFTHTIPTFAIFGVVELVPTPSAGLLMTLLVPCVTRRRTRGPA